MQTTWIVAADEHRVRIFEVEGAQSHLQEVQDFVSPEGRMREQDLTSDAIGRYFGGRGGNRGHTTEPNVSKSQHEQEIFARQVTDFLDKARLDHRYDKLRVIAFSKFLGMLRKNMSKDSQKLVEDEVSKDISNLDVRDIEEYVKTRLH